MFKLSIYSYIMVRMTLISVAGYYLGRELTSHGINFVSILLMVFIYRALKDVRVFSNYYGRLRDGLRRGLHDEYKKDSE